MPLKNIFPFHNLDAQVLAVITQVLTKPKVMRGIPPPGPAGSCIGRLSASPRSSHRRYVALCGCSHPTGRKRKTKAMSALLSPFRIVK